MDTMLVYRPFCKKKTCLSDVLKCLRHKNCEIQLIYCLDFQKVFSKVSQRSFLKSETVVEQRGKSSYR